MESDTKDSNHMDTDDTQNGHPQMSKPEAKVVVEVKTTTEETDSSQKQIESPTTIGSDDDCITKQDPSSNNAELTSSKQTPAPPQNTVINTKNTSNVSSSPPPTDSILEDKFQKTVQQPTSLPINIKQSVELTKLDELCERISNVQKATNLEPVTDDSIKTTESILQLLVTDDLSSIRNADVLEAFFVNYLKDLPPKSARGLLPSCINYLLLDSSTSHDQNEQIGGGIGLTKHFLREWINLLIAHSCDVEELKSIIKLSESDPSLLNFILQANLKQRNRPHAFFAFPGTKGSVMSLPPFQKWPIQLGWSFSTWFFLEPKACAQPYLYNFKTGKSGLGFSAHFTGNCLVLTSIRVKGKGVQHCVAYEFPSYKWIHCAITYHNKWRASEIKVYVNGQLTANIEMPWQVQTSEMFDKCFIGGSGSMTGSGRTGDLNCFCGQMSAIYLFNEGLSPTQICALHRLGPSYMGQFKYSNESHVNLPTQIYKTLYEEKLASSLFCLFTPIAVDSGTLCIQMAPFKSSTSASAQNYFMSAPHAALFGQTKAIIIQPISSTLQSLGCSRSLLPLLDVFATRCDADACASLVGFICDLLESSPHWFSNEIVQNNGFVVVACVLAKNARVLITERFLDIVLNLTRTLLTTSTTASDTLLLKHLMDNILFNPSLWVYADTKLQIKLYSYLSNEFLHGTRHGSNKLATIHSSSNSLPYIAYNPTSGAAVDQNFAYNDEQSKSGYYENVVADLLFGEVRRVSTVLQSLHALKYYYWMVEEDGINQKARNPRLRPSQRDLATIRSHILTFTKELILRANTAPLDEIQGLLNYLSACGHKENLVDALAMLSQLISDQPTRIVAALDQKQGIRVLFTLVGSKSEQIRIETLRLISLFLSQCSHKKKQDIMGPSNLFMLLCDRLRVYRPITLELYEALIDLMIEEENSGRKLDDTRSMELSKKRIENSMVIKVIANLLRHDRTTSQRRDEDDNEKKELIDIRKIFINDLWNLIVNSRENRRIILQMSVWQYWLINLIDSTIDESQLVRDQVLAIFRVLLYHAIRYEYGGWRVWIDTLAIIHSKVSYDEFCRQIRQESSVEDQQQQLGVTTINTRDTEERQNVKSPPIGHKEGEEGEGQAVVEPITDDNQEKPMQTIVSSISEHVHNESRGIEMSSSNDESTEELETKRDDPEKEPDTVDTVNNTEDRQQVGHVDETNTSEGVDSTDLAPSRAFRRASLDNNIENSEDRTLTPTNDSDGGSSDVQQLTRQLSMTSIPLDEQPQTECEDHVETIEHHDDEQHENVDNSKQDDTNISGPHSIQSHKATASPAFRIPEFRWTNMLVKLLNDLMFSIECDLYHWRCIANLNSLDVLPFVPKTAPTGSSTSSNSNATTRANAQNTTQNQIDSVLRRAENQIYIVNIIHLVSQLADNVIIAAGGLLPLLADATGGPKTSSSNSLDTKAFVTSEGLSVAQANSLLYRLINMVDMVIFAASHINLAELEADKNSTSGGIMRQCLRLACTVTVKNCLVLRNLHNRIFSEDANGESLNVTNCDLPNDMFDSYQGCSFLSANGLFQDSALILDNTDLIADLEYSPHQTPNTSSMPSKLPFQTNPIKNPNKLLQMVDISRIQTCIYYDNSTESRQSQFLALSSLYFISVLMVSKYRDIIEPKHKSKRTKSVSSSQGSPAPSVRSDQSPVDGETQNNNSAPVVSSVEANLLNFGKMQPNNPNTSNQTTSALTNMLTTKLENTLDSVCPLLKSIMCDFCTFLSKTLVGSHGQDLVNKEAERTFRRLNTSPVELVMLLCSQEWQNTLQKNAGLAFIELINEGRVLSHGMKDHIVRVAMEAEFILSRLRADDVSKHEQFGLVCSESLSARLHEEVLINSLINSAVRRDFMLYCKFKDMVQNEARRNYKLDIWEDDDRRKRRFIFDSWDDSSQSFYSSKLARNFAAESADSNDTNRILELQKTIEMGGIDDHCTPVGVISPNRDDFTDDIHADSQDGSNDESDEEMMNTCDEHQNNSHTSKLDGYANAQPTNRLADSSNDNLGSSNHQMKIRDAYEAAATTHGKLNKLDPNHNHQLDAHDVSNTDSRSNQAWEYDDCGSVTDFTGSVIFAAECSLIWSIYAIPGLLQITSHELYFETNQNIAEAIDLLKRDSRADDEHEEACLRSARTNHQPDSMSFNEQFSLRRIDLKALRYCDFLKSNSKFSLGDIRAIFSRHYLLQPNALEIFLAHRTSVMFAFADFDTVKRIIKYLPPVGVGIKYGIPQSRRASLMSPRQLFAASNMTQKWQKREIGNFQYLMFLNTIAGRTYQDLNQYPVFPWILTNYESEELDLNLPTNFRDLSKPVGALNTKRRSEFIERYQSWDNPKVPAFHYGTHYSTAAFTLNWLCRLRGAYNSSYLALQDGKYEEESRLFLSIGDSWVSSLVGGNQNVKELIPEFFYLPEMFHSNLGLSEVEYPPWAKSAEEFVRIHRIALESELVSCQLHQWIDLIFGYKQRGPEAVNSVNTFYYLTYQGNVNLNMIQDQSLRDAIETQIKHFGQTPSQLTNEPHPPRFSALHSSPLMFATNPEEVSKVVKFPFNNPIVHISSCINNHIAPSVSITDGSISAPGSQNQNVPSSVMTITGNNQYQIHKWMPNNPTGGHPFTIDPQLEGPANNLATRRQLIDVDDMCPGFSMKLSTANSRRTCSDEVQLSCTHYIVTLNGRYIIMGSFYDNSFRVFSTENGKLCQVIYGHRGPITCLTRSEGNAVADFFIATGSQDCSLLIWTWNERFAQVEGNGVSAVHNPLPKLSINGHHTPVLSAAICSELGLIISGSKNLILVHTTTTGENLLQIDVDLPNILDRTMNENKLHITDSSLIQRPRVQDKKRTILEASMLGDTGQNLKSSQQKVDLSRTSSRSQSPNSLVKDEKLSQLKDLCCSDYYITNLQLARELAFIVCVALPPPRKKSTRSNELGGKSSPALLLTFNLKGSLMDSRPIGQSVSCPRLGDVCALQISRDGEHLILNDSPITIKIYRTFGLQPIYAYNTNDISNTLSEDQNRIRSLTLLDQRYILVGLENGKIIVYNSEFKNH